jgi:autotransporter-associated beta strand protein
MTSRRLIRVLFAMLLSWPLLVSAQTLTIDNDILSYPTLTNTTVTMTGRSELRITGASSPISGSVINLNSPDAWFFMTNIRPSVVNSTYLSQVRVNGAAAVHGTNCRVVMHGDGTVVIPHAPSYAPLTVYTGKLFTGTSMSLAPYTAYGPSNLGAFNDKISSFKLKRGYLATLAQNSAGTGISKCYVAQDGDIEVSVLPDDLNDSVSFVRVFPWRWVNKKGIAGNLTAGLNVRWWYNWNIDQNSPFDEEYVAIKQNRWWPDLTAQNWQTRGINHLLGYNEPDHPDQANMTIADAISSWPDLLATGLRVGSPAPTDGGRSSWLYPFMDQANAAGLRVDFVVVHYYWCYNPADPAGAANQMYNFLKAVYDQTGRPIWITEWNQGANWTACADPTPTQHQASIAAMIDMLDNTPFVERYALFNWVEDVRRVKWDDGTLTASGTTYRDKVSPLSYWQDIPEVPLPAGALYRFENNTADTFGNGQIAVMKGAAKYTTGKTGQGASLSGNGDYVQLSPRIGDSTDFTFGAWVYWNGGANWQRIFDLGAGTSNYLFLTPSSGSGTLRFAIKDGGGEQQLNHTAALPTNMWTHVAVTINGNTGKLFVNGALVATNTSMTLNPVDVGTQFNFLGKSQFSADPYFAGRLDDVQFLPYALADAKIAAMMTNNPPAFSSSVITGTSGTQGTPYSGTIAGTATDPDAGETLSYSKVSGPAWLTVAANGALGGTPTFDDDGLQEFVVAVTDSVGATGTAVLNITLPTISGNGTWTSAGAGGLWSDASKWSASFPANGAGNTANFSTLNITSDLIVTLDRSRTIGALSFGDTSGSQNWTLNSTGGSTLTLEPASGSSVITVSQNTATISAPIAGTSGLSKSGAGTLVLSGDNSFSGILYVDTSTSSGTAGTLRIANPDAITDIASISIRNNNDGSSTLELDGTSRDIGSSKAISLSGRNVAVTAIRNLAGNNTLSGPLTLFQGGGNYILQSAGGTLNLAGTITSTAGGTRTLTFPGNSNTNVSGSILDGTSTVTVLAVSKSGTGTLTFSAANTYTGATTISAGTMVLNGSLTSPLTTATGTTLSGTGSNAGTTTVNGTHAPGNPLGTQTFTGTLAYSASARLKWTLSSDSIGAGASSRVTAGPVNVTSGAALDLVFNAAGSTTNYFNFFWTQPRSWTVASSSGMTGTFTLGTVSADSGGRIASNYGTFNLTQNAAGVTLNWTPKPYAAWRGTKFGANAGNTSISQFLSNPDGDELVNVLEYFQNTDPTAGTANPQQTQIISGRLVLTFTHNTDATDVIANVRGADSADGPWTDLARSTNGAPFTPLVAGVTINETGAGTTRTVEVRDLYLTTDPAHPKRFLRLSVEAQ